MLNLKYLFLRNLEQKNRYGQIEEEGCEEKGVENGSDQTVVG